MLIKVDSQLYSQLSREEEANLYSAAVEQVSLWDIQLRSSDGSLVPASRFVLARESMFFRQMFCNEFSDSASETLQIDVNGCTLQKLISAVHSNQVRL